MFDIKIIESGYIMADGGAMFGAIPKRAWQRKYSCDENNLCRLAMRCVLAISDERKILVDTGIGVDELQKVAYYQPHNLVRIDEAISAYGVTANEITDVVLTHLHFDHCGYATHRNENGKIAPSFPNARYWLSAKQWKNMSAPNRLEEDAIFAPTIQPLFDAGILHILEEENTNLCEGFQIRHYDGHSEGQLVAFIDVEDGITTFPGDLIPTASHVPLGWISAYDISAIKSLTEKERFLVEAQQMGYTLIYCHDSTVVKSKVKRLNDNFTATEVVRI